MSKLGRVSNSNGFPIREQEMSSFFFILRLFNKLIFLTYSKLFLVRLRDKLPSFSCTQKKLYKFLRNARLKARPTKRPFP